MWRCTGAAWRQEAGQGLRRPPAISRSGGGGGAVHRCHRAACSTAAAASPELAPRPPAILLEAAAADGDAFAALAAWIEGAGGSARRVTAGPCDMGGGLVVRGLIAAEPLPQGATALSVPLRLALRDGGAAPPYEGAPWNVALAVQLLQLTDLGSRGPNWAYLRSLPPDAATPAAFPDALIAAAQYPPAMAAMREMRDLAARGFAAWQAAQQGRGGRAGVGQFDQFLWALHMVQSRSIRMALLGCRVMLPAIDLLNHGGSAANGTLALSRAEWAAASGGGCGGEVDGLSVCFVTSRDVAAGEQLLWTYGNNRSNDDFLTAHGFVLGGNESEDVVMFDSPAEAVRWWVGACGTAAPPATQADRAQLIAAAEAAAAQAQAEATVGCSAPLVPGTTSALLVRWEAQPAAVQLPEGPGAAAGGVPTWQQWVQGLRRQEVERKLASLRLHRPDWGFKSCPPLGAELVLRADGSMDVRLAALALWLAATLGSGPAWRQLLATRCRELLAGYPTRADEDEALLAGGQLGELEAAVVTYRLGKKRVLQRWGAP